MKADRKVAWYLTDLQVLGMMAVVAVLVLVASGCVLEAVTAKACQSSQMMEVCPDWVVSLSCGNADDGIDHTQDDPDAIQHLMVDHTQDDPDSARH